MQNISRVIVKVIAEQNTPFPLFPQTSLPWYKIERNYNEVSLKMELTKPFEAGAKLRFRVALV